MSDQKRIELERCDGIHGYQVMIFDNDDMKYWKGEAERTGHKMVFDSHIPYNAFHTLDPAHDRYQIIPPDFEWKRTLVK